MEDALLLDVDVDVDVVHVGDSGDQIMALLRTKGDLDDDCDDDQMNRCRRCSDA